MTLKILDILSAAGAISRSTQGVVKKFASTWGCSGFNALLKTHVFDEIQLADLLSQTLRIDRIYNVSSIVVNGEMLHRIPYDFSIDFECLPLNFSHSYSDRMEVLMADPTNEVALQQLKSLLGCELSLAVGERSDIVKAINRLYPVEMQLPGIGGGRDREFINR
jgi:hypothetical protein